MPPLDERDQVADSRENANASAADVHNVPSTGVHSTGVHSNGVHTHGEDGDTHAAVHGPAVDGAPSSPSATISTDVHGATHDDAVAPVRSRAPVAALPVRLAPLDHLLTLGGVGCTLGGVGLAVCGVVAPGLVAPLASLGSPVLVGGMLALGGAVLVGVGRVRRALGSVERTLTVVQVETERIDGVAQDGRDLRRDIGGVSDSTSALRHEMTTVQRRLDELTKLAANPEIQTSMFHLAASQDQLAKRLDLAMTDRFRALSTEIGGMAESVARSQREFATELRNVAQHVDERFTAHDRRVQHVLDVLQTENKEQRTRIDRIFVALECVTQELVKQRDALVEGLGAANDAAQRVAKEQATNLEVLREQVDNRLQAHALSLDEHVERVRRDVQQRVDDARTAQTDALRELAERVRSESAEHAAAAHRSIADLGVDLDAALERARTEFAVGIAALAPRLEELAEERSSALLARLDADAQSARDTWSTLERRLGEVESEVQRRLAAAAAEVTRRWNELANTNAQEAERLHARLAELASEARSTSTELRADVVALAPRLEAVAHERLERLQADVRESATELKSGVDAAMTQLERGFERVDGEQARRHDELVRCVQDEHARDRGELERSLSALDAQVVETGRQVQATVARRAAELEPALASSFAALDAKLVEASREVQAVVTERVGALEPTLERSLASLETKWTGAQQALQAAVVDRVAGIAPELERMFEVHAGGLRTGLDGVARATGEGEGRVREKLGELEALLARSMTRIDDGQATVLGEISGQLTADRMRAERALQEGLRSLETSLQLVHDELAQRVGTGESVENGANGESGLAELRSHVQAASRAAESATEALRTGFDELSKRFDERLRERNQSLTDDLLALAELARETSRGPRAVEQDARADEVEAEDVPAPSSPCLPHRIEDDEPAVECALSDPPAALPRPQRADVEALADGAPLFVAQLPTTTEATNGPDATATPVASEALPPSSPAAEAPATETRPNTGDSAH
ncbi:MAG: hypothetical protein L6Q99_03565 [Planctomycetes bacterium]|nr:hypothetical protein [Planctomycetota bacterium]